jgi:rod shape determining protein RodA
MQGTQSRLNFLPEKQTDFILNTLAEEFGFLGSFTLLSSTGLILLFLFSAAMQARDRFSSLLITGIGCPSSCSSRSTCSWSWASRPVVGVPLPLVSYGGSQLLVLLIAFGLVQSAHVHRPPANASRRPDSLWPDYREALSPRLRLAGGRGQLRATPCLAKARGSASR